MKMNKSIFGMIGRMGVSLCAAALVAVIGLGLAGCPADGGTSGTPDSGALEVKIANDRDSDAITAITVPTTGTGMVQLYAYYKSDTGTWQPAIGAKWYKNGVEITGLFSGNASLTLYTASGSYASNTVAYMPEATITGSGIIEVTGGETFKATLTLEVAGKTGTTAEVTVTVQ